MVRAGGGCAKGLKGGGDGGCCCFLGGSGDEEEEPEGGGGLGLLAREGEKRSWNCEKGRRGPVS